MILKAKTLKESAELAKEMRKKKKEEMAKEFGDEGTDGHDNDNDNDNNDFKKLYYEQSVIRLTTRIIFISTTTNANFNGNGDVLYILR